MRLIDLACIFSTCVQMGNVSPEAQTTLFDAFPLFNITLFCVAGLQIMKIFINAEHFPAPRAFLVSHLLQVICSLKLNSICRESFLNS